MARKKPVPAAPAEPLTVTRSLNLEPADWMRATWRPRTPLVRKPAEVPRPDRFDLGDCLSRFRSLKRNQYGRWDYPLVPGSMSREEAHFWLTLLPRMNDKADAEALAREFRQRAFDGQPSAEEVAGLLIGILDLHELTQGIYRVVETLLPSPRFAAMLLHLPASPPTGFRYSWNAPRTLLERFLEHHFPYLTDEEIASLRPRVRIQLAAATWPAHSFDIPDLSFWFAALLGLHDELRAVVERWPDNAYNQQPNDTLAHRPEWLVLGLGDPRLVEHHMRRLRLPLSTGREARAWMAHTEFAALDCVAESVRRETNRASATELTEALGLAVAPETAPAMLQLLLFSRAPKAARSWLHRHLGNALAGMLSLAGGRGKVADLAGELLRQAVRGGHRAFLDEQLALLPPEVVERVHKHVFHPVAKEPPPFDDATTPQWLRALVEAPFGTRTDRAPSWLDPAALPPVVIGDHRLNRAQVERLLIHLKRSPLDSPTELVTAVRMKAERASLDAFAWWLFQAWMFEESPSGEKWCFTALGHLGGDATALRLAPLLRDWPAEGRQKLANHGLECLCAIGTDTALMQLNAIAQKVRFKGLQTLARGLMQDVAIVRGLSKAQLEDRVVPDLDLDAHGSRTFDYGPRQFRLVLDGELKPMVRDEAGKLKADLPKPTQKDDATKANAALAEWKLLKKQLREVVKVQAARLEQAMIVGRRWPVAEFDGLLVRHPLMTNLVRRLVWGGFDEGGKLAATFRVTEEQEMADRDDAPVRLEGVAGVGVIHPLELPAGQREGWSEVFGEYELVAPFPQLGRPVYGLNPGEEVGTNLERFGDVKIPGISVVSYLDRVGWSRGESYHHYDFNEFTRFFEGYGVTAVVEVEPGLYGSIRDMTEEVSIKSVFFYALPTAPAEEIERANPLPLGQVHPIVLSEVLMDLHHLAAKGK